MNGDPLNEFQRDIAPYRSVWRSVRVSGLATREDGHWISLGLRVSLSELVPEPVEVTPVYDWFAYFNGRSPIEHFDRLADELVRGRYLTIPPDPGTEGGPRVRLYLNREAARALAGLDEEAFQQARTPRTQAGPSWDYLGLRKSAQMPVFGTDRATYSLLASGERSTTVLGYQDQQRVDDRLRAGEPAFDGLAGLIGRLLPGLPSRIDQAQLQIVAPLPFYLVRLGPGRLAVRAPAASPRGALSLRFFFRPGELPPSTSFGLQPQNAVPSGNGTIEWGLDIPWPERSATAKASLLFLDREIDSLVMQRWAAGASVRAVLDDYFDHGRKRLLQSLGVEPYPKKQQDEQRRFESAVARLMSLLGVPLTWFGDWLAMDRRPDLGGLAEVGGKKVAILGECTLVRPEEKFSELHKRAEELGVALGTEAEVLAVVFTQAPTTQSEARRAAEHAVVLVGPDELRRLIGLLQYPEDSDSVLSLLRQLRSRPIGPLEWPPQYS